MPDISKKGEIKFNICIVVVNEHWQMLKELIDILRHSIVEIGFLCSTTVNEFREGAINIVVGMAVFAEDHGLLDYARGKKYVLYQMEQLHKNYGLLPTHDKYGYMIKEAGIIFEYSPRGLEFLREHGLGSKSYYLPPAYHRIWERRNWSTDQNADIDVLLFGANSERREKIISSLNDIGVNAILLDYSKAVYGSILD